MFLSSSQCEEIDVICSRFEVALRSYVSDLLLRTIGEAQIIPRLTQMTTISTSSMHAQRYSGKAGSLANPKTVALLKNAQTSFTAGEIIEGDIPTLGQTIDLIFLFYNEVFQALGRGFPTIQQFDAKLADLNTVRGALAHPASARITKVQAEEAMELFRGVEPYISDEYYWYSSKAEIRGLMAALASELARGGPIDHNLDAVARRHSALLMRTDELARLRDLIIGNSPYGRTSDSVEIYGWGGVGKTALAFEFCYEVLRLQANRTVDDYTFILWLSSKSEELSYNPVTGSLRIKPLRRQYGGSADVLAGLKEMLSLPQSLSAEELMGRLADGKKGLIVLDNLENLPEDERKKIGSLIRKFPRNIKIILTSRNYEDVADTGLRVDGFVDNRGIQFLRQYCESKGFSSGLDEKELAAFVKASCGNTLILVLGMDRVIEDKATLSSLTAELEGTKQADLETLAAFMYRNTFESVLREIDDSKLGVDIPSLLTALHLYGEIDLHSLRELLGIDDVKTLESVLERLESKFVVSFEQGYYRIHEFAAKFVVLKLRPDSVRLKELMDRVSEYRTKAQKELDDFYADRERYEKLSPILDDWSVETGGDVLAFAQAYNEYSRVKDRHEAGISIHDLVNSVRARFEQIERRSYHPYIRFQKARILEALRHEASRVEAEGLALDDEIDKAYEDTYLMVNLKHRRVAGTESYPVFLWFYGSHLTRCRRTDRAVRVLEEAVACFRARPSLRKASNAAHCCLQLAYAMSIAYMQAPKEGYLNKIKSLVYEAESFFRAAKEEPSEDERKTIPALLLFADSVLLSQPCRLIDSRLREIGAYPRHLGPIVRFIRARM